MNVEEMIENQRRQLAEECEVCCDRDFLWVEGSPHLLNIKGQAGKVEIRRCAACELIYFAVPLPLWADVVLESRVASENQNGA